ncbi:hypothetical protein [Gordonia alkaliphila]|uniref:Uncharacterized protein n=1 Tax=Gordonia alkaliphila TaxID=1053547 RepID=A0ABP8ZKQ8_9ACTN
MSAAQRKWLYGIATAVVAIAVAYGLIAQDQAALWLALAAAILSGGGNLVAGGHVSPDDDGGKWRRGRRVG